jgi:hypothetical protein
MSGMTEIFQENPAAAVFGFAGLLCQVIWPIFRARSAIMTAQFGIGADYGVQYALMGAWSGAGVCALGATQTALALFAGDKTWVRWFGPAAVPVVGAICIATWSGPESLCALIAVSLIMIGRAQSDALRLRMLLLAAAPFGMAYDVFTGALPALMGGMLSAAIAVAMLVREIKSRRAPVFAN